MIDEFLKEPRNTRNTRKMEALRGCEMNRNVSPYDFVVFLSCFSCIPWFALNDEPDAGVL